MAVILLIDHSKTTKKAVGEIFRPEHKVISAREATSAIEIANDSSPDAVILELSLAGHSGMEFLYEFRTYSDWKDVPIIIYSNIRLEPIVLKSKSWQQLNIASYLYKPESTLELLKSTVLKNLHLAHHE